MPYSYTEKKRIRKNFGTFAQVMDLPNLIETQTNSYAEFLQADVAPEARKKQGLEEVFQSLFPIKSVSGNAALEYVSYELGKNTYDVQECLIQGLTYSAPLRIKVKLVLFDRDSNFQDKFHSITLKWEKNKLSFFLDTNKKPYFSVDRSHPEFQKYDYPFNRKYYMILNVAVGGKYDDFWVDGNAFCTDALCSNKSVPDDHRFLIDWIEYRKL